MKDQIPSVIITGASGGIGKKITERFARGGYRLFLQGNRHMEDLHTLASTFKNTYHVPIHILQADVSDYASVDKMFQQILAEDPAPDVLVNNAGIAFFSLLQDMSEADWDLVMNTNVKSVFACCKAVLPSMIARQRGSIINISSMWGNVGSSMEVAYSASKGAINAFTRALGKEVAPSGIRINAIACGVIDTPMNHCLSPEDRQALAEEIPAGRFGRPEEVADLTWFLAGPESSYMNAQVLTLDGAYL
ncbi:MAG: 3-oxoacyl-ACP reductase FabG [Firmicutes bacterium]|nr:3-oxoacyl-ACP reductase FabG [Bacillota bacterium]